VLTAVCSVGGKGGEEPFFLLPEGQEKGMNKGPARPTDSHGKKGPAFFLPSNQEGKRGIGHFSCGGEQEEKSLHSLAAEKRRR